MTSQEITDFALSFPETTEVHPFGPVPDVYKVAGRIFLFLIPEADRPRIALKCEPTLALLLREKYPAVTPGYHLNKVHWNSLELDGSIPDDELQEMIHHSFDQVVAKLPKAKREWVLRAASDLERG